MTSGIDEAVHGLVFALGMLVVGGVLGSAVSVTVLPRGVGTRLGRAVFVGVRLVFKVRIRSGTRFAVRDRVLALYAPLSLLSLLATWLVLAMGGFAAMFWGLGVHPVRRAFGYSGSSMFTLGFEVPSSLPATALTFVDAGVGLLLLALLITFLPTIYGAFHERETEVSKLEVQAGSPPTAWNILVRLRRLERLDYRKELWQTWENWFVVVGNSHTTFPALPFFRSPLPEHSWVTASGALLDAAALSTSCLDQPRDIEAELCIRAGYLALRRIAALFRLPFDPDPRPDDPIAVTKLEFDEVWDQLSAAGLPLKADREQAWRAFVGWRVNYETVLIRLATLTEAPLAPWSSDRGLVDGRRLTFIERIRR